MLALVLLLAQAQFFTMRYSNVNGVKRDYAITKENVTQCYYTSLDALVDSPNTALASDGANLVVYNDSMATVNFNTPGLFPFVTIHNFTNTTRLVRNYGSTVFALDNNQFYLIDQVSGDSPVGLPLGPFDVVGEMASNDFYIYWVNQSADGDYLYQFDSTSNSTYRKDNLIFYGPKVKYLRCIDTALYIQLESGQINGYDGGSFFGIESGFAIEDPNVVAWDFDRFSGTFGFAYSGNSTFCKQTDPSTAVKCVAQCPLLFTNTSVIDVFSAASGSNSIPTKAPPPADLFMLAYSAGSTKRHINTYNNAERRLCEATSPGKRLLLFNDRVLYYDTVAKAIRYCTREGALSTGILFSFAADLAGIDGGRLYLFSNTVLYSVDIALLNASQTITPVTVHTFTQTLNDCVVKDGVAYYLTSNGRQLSSVIAQQNAVEFGISFETSTMRSLLLYGSYAYMIQSGGGMRRVLIDGSDVSETVAVANGARAFSIYSTNTLAYSVGSSVYTFNVNVTTGAPSFIYDSVDTITLLVSDSNAVAPTPSSAASPTPISVSGSGSQNGSFSPWIIAGAILGLIFLCVIGIVILKLVESKGNKRKNDPFKWG